MTIRRSFSKHYTHSNIQLNKVCALWKYTEWWASSRSNGSRKKVFKTLYPFKHTIEQKMRFRGSKLSSNKHFKQNQWLSEEVFQNNIHIQAYSWTKYALCESRVSDGLQSEAMALKKFFKTLYTFKIQLNKVWALWKYTEWLASSRSNGFQKKFFKTLYTFKHTIEQSMRSVKVHWDGGLQAEAMAFRIILHIQTNNWTKMRSLKYAEWWASSRSNAFRTKYALRESTLSGGLEAEAMTHRRNFSKHSTHSNIQFNKVCALSMYSEWWASIRSNGFRKKFLKILYSFKQTFEQIMHSVKVHWVVGLKQKQWLPENVFQNIITHSNIQLNKICALWKYTEWWASSRSNCFQKKFFKTIYTFKHTVEQSMRSVKIQWVMGFNQKQWLSKEVFQNIIHIQTYNWTKYALSQSTLSRWAWASSRSNGFQSKFFETLYTFEHTIEQSMRSLKLRWVVGFKQKQ